jgi:hypothetical protein
MKLKSDEEDDLLKNMLNLEDSSNEYLNNAENE